MPEEPNPSFKKEGRIFYIRKKDHQLINIQHVDSKYRVYLSSIKIVALKMGLLDISLRCGICVIRFNNPKKLNAWSQRMMKEKSVALAEAASDPSVKAVVVTGTGKYYCAGVDLSAVLKPMNPKTLVGIIKTQNQALFDTFIDFPKPIFAAINGPAVGAAVTTATLCDGIVANQHATFHTPFQSLGLVPEGCSSVLFPEIFGEEMAKKMLIDGHKLQVTEALEHGMISSITVSDSDDVNGDVELQDAAVKLAEEYVEKNGIHRKRTAEERLRLKQVNEQESIDLANAFVSENFLRAMESQAERKGNGKVKYSFAALRIARPIWSLLL